MPIDLVAMIRRVGKTRRTSITLRPIEPTRSLMMDLAHLAVQIPAGWQDHADAILTTYEQALARTGVSDAAIRDNPEDLERELEAAANEMYRLLLVITPQMTNWTVAVEKWHREKFIQAILSPTGVDLRTLLGPAGDTMETFRQSALALIRNIDDDTRSKIAGAVWRGFQNRAPRREIAREISNITGIARRRALFIAQDQTVKMAARLDRARQEEVGLTEYEWRHSGKLRPRPVHVARNGRIYRWSKPPEDGHPGTQPYCGCKALGHISLG